MTAAPAMTDCSSASPHRFDAPADSTRGPGRSHWLGRRDQRPTPARRLSRRANTSGQGTPSELHRRARRGGDADRPRPPAQLPGPDPHSGQIGLFGPQVRSPSPSPTERTASKLRHNGALSTADVHQDEGLEGRGAGSDGSGGQRDRPWTSPGGSPTERRGDARRRLSGVGRRAAAATASAVQATATPRLPTAATTADSEDDRRAPQAVEESARGTAPADGRATGGTAAIRHDVTGC